MGGAAGAHGRKLRALELFTRHMQLQMLLSQRSSAGALDELAECVREVDAAAAAGSVGAMVLPNGTASGKKAGKKAAKADEAGGDGGDGEKPAVSEVVVDLVL